MNSVFHINTASSLGFSGDVDQLLVVKMGRQFEVTHFCDRNSYGSLGRLQCGCYVHGSESSSQSGLGHDGFYAKNSDGSIKPIASISVCPDSVQTMCDRGDVTYWFTDSSSHHYLAGICNE